jgi:anion-transporting  ArsA/GET3 family ATPase
MLTTPRTFGEIARVGPIRRQAGRIRDTLADRGRTGYLAVALPEEMPVNETLELEERLPSAVGPPLDAIVVNGVYPERFTKAEAERLRAVAANGHDPDREAALRAALTEYERARAQRVHLRRLRRHAAAPVLTLPFLFEPQIGLEEWRRLGHELERKL